MRLRGVQFFLFSAVCLQFSAVCLQFVKKIGRFSNAFWLYQHRVRNAQFQSYSQKTFQILIWVTLYNKVDVNHFCGLGTFVQDTPAKLACSPLTYSIWYCISKGLSKLIRLLRALLFSTSFVFPKLHGSIRRWLAVEILEFSSHFM